LIWDARAYEQGLDRGVFYPKDGPGEAWNGLISVQEDSANEEVSSRYIDGVKTHLRRRVADFSGSIEAFTYPNSLHSDILTQTRRKSFGLSYRVRYNGGYKIHLIYNVDFPRGEISRKQSETDPFIWDFTTKPIVIPEAKLSAHLVIDTTDAYSSTLSDLEDVLYGTPAESARLPTPEEIFNIFEANSILRIIDHGDGTWTAIGPDSAIQMIDATTFQITWPSAVYIDAVSYDISSL